MTAHPGDLARRVTDHHRVVRHVLVDHGAGADEGVAAHGDAADDGGVGPDRAAAPQDGFLVERVPIHLRARVRHIGQHAGGPEEYVVFDHHAGVHRHVVLDLDVGTDGHAAVHVDVLSDDAALA